MAARKPATRFKTAIYEQIARIGKAAASPGRLELLRDEYLAGHIPGAVSLPLADLKKRVPRLPKTRDIVADCRGPYCVMALDAVDILRRRGFRAHRMEHGVLEWRAHGWRVETGDHAQAERRP